MALSPELRQLIESGPLVHLSTINADGSPQVSVVWVALDGDDLLTSHLGNRQLKLRNIERDPRVVLSFLAPPAPGVFLAHHAILRAHAALEGPSEDAWELLDRMAKVYMGPDVTFPAPRAEGYVVRHTIEKVGGVGPWA
jgi:PPOX class probable F420-dependent enzyme